MSDSPSLTPTVLQPGAWVRGHPAPPGRAGSRDVGKVWEWAGDHWRVREIPPFEEPNAGGSPAPTDS